MKLRTGPSTAGIILIAGLLIFFLWVGGYFETEKRNKYLVPRGYAGWLCVSYGIPNEQPLKVGSDGFAIVKFDSSGVAKTSSLGKPGQLIDKYFYLDNGSEIEVPASNFGGGGTYSDSNRQEGHFASYFWISPNPKDDFERAGSPSSEVLRGKCFE
jgi:hypothetical protein